jgi:type I restriction enzyme S subunit
MELRAGYKNTEIGVIPEDWDVVELGGIGTFKNGINKGKEDFGHGFPFVNLMDVFGKPKIYGTEIFDLINSNDAERNLYNLKYSDLLFIRSSVKPSGVGLTSVINKNLKNTVFSGFLIRFRDNGSLNIEYKKHCFYEEKFRNRLIASSSVSANTNINQESLKGLKIPLPPLPEQTAIATVLSDTDNLLQTIEKKIAKKRLIKQGAMQELLKPKEGWVVKSLGVICDIRKGQLITSDTKINGNIPVIAGGKKPAYYHNTPNRKGKTITVSGSGANAGYVSFHNYPIFASDCSTINESDNYSIEYIFFFLQKMQERIYKMQTGGAQPHIHPKDLNPIEFAVPKKEEQIQIAKILSNMDFEIKGLEKQLAKYKQVKQGLMQNLLTGKIRLV